MTNIWKWVEPVNEAKNVSKQSRVLISRLRFELGALLCIQVPCFTSTAHVEVSDITDFQKPMTWLKHGYEGSIELSVLLWTQNSIDPKQTWDLDPVTDWLNLV